ncbi:mRNA cap guanine-N7 methyltransferase [Cryptotrichosporon argae]
MVYDPIRDREFPSPAQAVAAHPAPWGNGSGPGPGVGVGVASRDGVHAQADRHSLSSATSSPPVLPRSGPSGLRGLLNDAQHAHSQLHRRNSGRSSFSSAHDDEREPARSAPAPSPSLSRLLNIDSDPPTSHPLTKASSSSSSIPPASSLSPHPSPGARPHVLDHSGFLTPGTPASAARPRSTASRSPLPGHAPLPHSYSAASSPATSTVPLEYAVGVGVGYGAPPYTPQAAGPSRRRTSAETRSSAGMMPPDVPRDYHDRTPGAGAHGLLGGPGALPLRSPSVSVSPKSTHLALAGYPASRPTSSSSSSHAPPPLPLGGAPAFFYPPTAPQSASPHSSRRPSEDFAVPRRASEDAAGPSSRPRSSSSATSASSARRLSSPAVRRGHVAAAPHRLTPPPVVTPVCSPSPIAPPRAPYAPRRLSEPHHVLYPLHADELVRLRALALANNPLRRRHRAAAAPAAPKWSAPSPRASVSIPSEHDQSYFPPVRQDARAPDGTAQPAARTPGAPTTPTAAYQPPPMGLPPQFADAQTPEPAREGKRAPASSRGEGSNHLKRSSSGHDDHHDTTRRKVSDTHYVGNASAVASFYNSRPEVGVEHRELSPIIGLKKFNNWIKSVLIGKFAVRGGARVLDIGCGKGGDLNKWKQARIRLYVGVDIAATSVEQAAQRYHTMNRPGFDGRFFAHDCYAKPISDVLPDDLRVRDLYDNVSMQFCMHYAFESASKARMMMENVCRYLRKGGIFVGTIPNSELLLQRLDAVPDDAPLAFGNSCFSIEFVERAHKGVYGHQYRFYLTDAVEDVPEYIVHWDNFVSLALEYGLHLVYKKTFNDVLQDEQGSRDFGPLLAKMGVLNDRGESAMDADQWEAANLYMAFAFEKR